MSSVKELYQAILNFSYLCINKTLCEDKMIQVIRICQGFKAINPIWMMFKKSKSWGEKNKERNFDILRKKYLSAAIKNTRVKQTRGNHSTSDFRNSSGCYCTEIMTAYVLKDNITFRNNIPSLLIKKSYILSKECILVIEIICLIKPSTIIDHLLG